LAGHSAVTVHLSGVSPSSLVLATPQRLESKIFLAAAVPGTNSFKISVNGPVAASLAIGWMVID
jgi:hypothetical protein